MRTGYRPNVFRDENEKIYAINLGSDFCAEHENGISGLINFLRIDKIQIGIDGYKAGRPAGEFVTSFKTGGVFFVLFNGYFKNVDIEALKKDYKKGGRHLYMGEEQTFQGAWSDNDFGLAVKVKDKETYQFAKELVKAIEKGDVALWFADNDEGNPFGRPGLTVGITSRISKEITDYMLQCDQEALKLKAADDATGIKELLESKGKKYFACRADWLKEGMVTCNGLRVSTYSVIYWLNPMDQVNHEYGWWTVEELTDWANGISGNKIDKVKKSETIKS